MLTARRLMIAFGPLTVVAVGACLVFDGLKPTAGEGGAGDESAAGDAAEDRTARHDGQAPDAAPGDGQGGDAALGDGATAEDAPGSDTSMPPGDGGISNGVVCGSQLCGGGPTHKCCAHGGGKTNLPWGYPSMRCADDCSEAGHGGYYGYECDDDQDCPPTKVCCAHGDSPPPFGQSLCKSTCSSPDMELCQPGRGCKKGACELADAKYLPPGYYWCQ